MSFVSIALAAAAALGGHLREDANQTRWRAVCHLRRGHLQAQRDLCRLSRLAGWWSTDIIKGSHLGV